MQANRKDTPKRPKHRLQAIKHGDNGGIEAEKTPQIAEIGHSFIAPDRPHFMADILRHRAQDSRKHPTLAGNPPVYVQNQPLRSGGSQLQRHFHGAIDHAVIGLIGEHGPQ
jgi:hypothetical protein